MWLYFLGKWIIRNVKPTADGRDQVVMVTFSMNVNGILDIKRATVDSTEIVESEPMEEDKSAEENAEQQPPADANSAAAPPPEVGNGWTKKIMNWFDRVRIIPGPSSYSFVQTFSFHSTILCSTVICLCCVYVCEMKYLEMSSKYFILDLHLDCNLFFVF